jgi:hypothetical protein
VQQRRAAAADFLEAARDRGRHVGGVADLFAIGAERLADLGEGDLGGELGIAEIKSRRRRGFYPSTGRAICGSGIDQGAILARYFALSQLERNGKLPVVAASRRGTK